ncbi:Peptide methionine sulfoxide reductase MsrA [metagenome]|uniref:peptide-methionine (S)-S-oxide reductase n=1 Tax=metagenome TaxID=256318 RepID=A0A2P2C349_9ZZZZ
MALRSNAAGTIEAAAVLDQAEASPDSLWRSIVFGRNKTEMPTPDRALPGRSTSPFRLSDRHRVLDAPVVTDTVPDGYEVAIFGLGCFWGAEEIYWQIPGVWSTSVGYAGGTTPHPSYEEVCSGRTGHTEAIRIVFDPAVVSYADLVKRFFEVHDPTQGMRQGNDVGTQYRSAIYVTTPEQEATARELTAIYGAELSRRRLGDITTEVRESPTYYYAEDQHQQYLAKNPHGYRCHANTGVKFPATA